jgi:hypothetical protein
MVVTPKKMLLYIWVTDCMTAEDNIGSQDEECPAEDTDSAESDDEDDITIEVDLSQEIYVDKSQVGVPYKKRYVLALSFLIDVF